MAPIEVPMIHAQGSPAAPRHVHASVRGRVSGMISQIIRRPNAATPARLMKAVALPSLSLI
jgi:hypothetical protein